ncbi:protein-signal peptide and transmembrane prediction [Bacteroidota bacterium]
MKAISLIIYSLLLIILPVKEPNKGDKLTLNLRNQINNGDIWSPHNNQVKWKINETAIIICDMWDKHWCEGANIRVGEMVNKMNDVVKAAREKGVVIIHSPSGTIDHYKDYPQRKKMMESPGIAASKSIAGWYYIEKNHEGDLPIDDSDGGCDTPSSKCVDCAVWTKQIEAIEIFNEDGISDDGGEINNYFAANGIKNVIIMGVHANMCVLGRPFGIRSQVKLGRNVVLVRDLTDTMYNPKMKPHVSHDEGTALVIEHIEKFWCPSIDSSDLLD